MELIVLVKQVPQMEDVKFDMKQGRIDRSSAGTQVNPFDLNALEVAVRLKESEGGKVTVISMGPPQAESALRKALARGADRAILLTDRIFAGADTKATSFTLAKSIEKLGKFDLIVCGEKTIDGDTAQVGPEVARMLGVPHMAYVSRVKKVDENGLEALCEVWGATYHKKMRFPGLLTVTKDINEPRLPSLKDKLKAKKAAIEKWGVEKFGDILTEKFGAKGSPTSVREVEIPEEEERKGEIFTGEPNECAKFLVNNLKERGILRE